MAAQAYNRFVFCVVVVEFAVNGTRLNCTGTVNVQGDASGRSKLIVQTLLLNADTENIK